ncbi:fungal hydrophobin-domain-containing protein [Gloeopeniophorella convolvens]|nr:fungal hydrophobin-domain-containing protein [Gloeopeniophorella convolvens]
MFSRLSTIFLYALVSFAVFAAAIPGGSPPPTTTTITVTASPTATTVSQCNVGGLQCCNSVQTESNPLLGILLGLLGVVLSGINVPIGVTCSPITVIGSGTSGCSAEPVCCENNNFVRPSFPLSAMWLRHKQNGVIAIGCSPININL